MILPRIMRMVLESSTMSAFLVMHAPLLSRSHPRTTSEAEVRHGGLQPGCHFTQLQRGGLGVIGSLGGVSRRRRPPTNVPGNVGDSLSSLVDTAADLVGGRCLLLHRRRDAVGNVIDLVNDGADFFNRCDRALGDSLDGLDLLTDLFGRFGGLFRSE